MFNCRECGKLVVGVEGFEMGDMCTPCWDVYTKSMEPRLNLLDKVILWFFDKRATFKEQHFGGTDPYSGHTLEIQLHKYITFQVSDTICWIGHVGKAFFNEDDWWIMPIAKRIFSAFETRDIIQDNCDEYSGYHRQYM